MRKRLAFLFIVTSFVSVLAMDAVAQPEIDTHWMVNLRGGVSNAGLYGGESLAKGGSRTGAAFQLSAELILNENVSWEFGLGVKQKGMEGALNSQAALDPVNAAPDDPDGLDFDGTIKLGYITLDATVNGGMQVGYSGWLGGYAGLGLGFLVNAQGQGVLNGRETDLDLEKTIKGEDFFGVIGAKYTYRFNNQMVLMFDYRAEIGLASIDDSNLDSGTKTYANIFWVGVGIPILTDPQ